MAAAPSRRLDTGEAQVFKFSDMRVNKMLTDLE
jgi:hypothetical protein